MSIVGDTLDHPQVPKSLVMVLPGIPPGAHRQKADDLRNVEDQISGTWVLAWSETANKKVAE